MILQVRRANKMKKWLLFPLLIFFSLSSFAQNLTGSQLRSFGENLSKDANNLNVDTIAITRTSAVGIYGGNGYYCESAPTALINRIKEINANKKNITDIHMTESGKWVILGDLIYWSDDIPTDCKNAIQYLIDDSDYIVCISFDDYGNWVVLGTNTFYASLKIKTYMEEARDKFGHLKYVNITNDAVIISCENGQFCSVGWNVPLVKNLSDALDIIEFKPKMIKLFPGVGCFIGNSDIYKWYAYFK